MKNSRCCWECSLTPNLNSNVMVIELIERNLQVFEISRNDDFLVVAELLEGGIALSHNFDVVADPHVVLVHHLDVFPLLKRTEQL